MNNRTPAELYEEANRLVAQSMRFRQVPALKPMADFCKQRALELRATASLSILMAGGHNGFGGYHPSRNEKSPPAQG